MPTVEKLLWYLAAILWCEHKICNLRISNSIKDPFVCANALIHGHSVVATCLYMNQEQHVGHSFHYSQTMGRFDKVITSGVEFPERLDLQSNWRKQLLSYNTMF